MKRRAQKKNHKNNSIDQKENVKPNTNKRLIETSQSIQDQLKTTVKMKSMNQQLK